MQPSTSHHRLAPRFQTQQALHPIIGAPLIDLNPCERIMLACDGTFTLQLEAYFREAIAVEILYYRKASIDASALRFMEADAQGELFERAVLLKGAHTETPFVFAHSCIDPARLPLAMQRDLETSPLGIGRLFVDFRLSIYRELIGYYFEDGAAYAELFPERNNLQFLVRLYRVYFEGRIVMLIAEKMPRDLFSSAS